MLQSISQLSRLTGFARETVAKRLEGLTAVEEKHSKQFESKDALPVLYEVAAGSSGKYDLVEERARLAHHQANNESLKESQNRGALIPAELVADLGSGLVGAARTKLLALHSKIRNRHPELSQELIDEIEDLHHETLSELGKDGLPRDIRKRIQRHIQRMESTAETHNQ